MASPKPTSHAMAKYAATVISPVPALPKNTISGTIAALKSTGNNPPSTILRGSVFFEFAIALPMSRVQIAASNVAPTPSVTSNTANGENRLEIKHPTVSASTASG